MDTHLDAHVKEFIPLPRQAERDRRGFLDRDEGNEAARSGHRTLSLELVRWNKFVGSDFSGVQYSSE